MVYNGIDTEKFSKYEGLKASRENSFTIGYAGRIANNKGINILIGAFKELSEKYPDVKLLLAGVDDRGYLQEVKKLIAKDKLQGKVLCLGFIKDMEVFYRTLDVFVLPSVVKEAFGLVLCEAMYSGVVVITTDSGAQMEIVDDGIDGYIIRSGSEVELIESIERVYLNREEKESIIKLAKRKVINKFSIDSCVNKILKIYNCL